MKTAPSPEKIASELELSLRMFRPKDIIVAANANIILYKKLYRQHKSSERANASLVDAASDLVGRFSLMHSRPITFSGEFQHINQKGNSCQHTIDEPRIAYIEHAIATPHSKYFANVDRGHIVLLLVMATVGSDWEVGWLSVGEEGSLAVLDNEFIVGRGLLGILRDDAAQRNLR